MDYFLVAALLLMLCFRKFLRHRIVGSIVFTLVTLMALHYVAQVHFAHNHVTGLKMKEVGESEIIAEEWEQGVFATSRFVAKLTSLYLGILLAYGILFFSQMEKGCCRCCSAERAVAEQAAKKKKPTRKKRREK